MLLIDNLFTRKTTLRGELRFHIWRQIKILRIKLKDLRLKNDMDDKHEIYFTQTHDGLMNEYFVKKFRHWI